MIAGLLLALAIPASASEVPFFTREVKDLRDVGALNENSRALSDGIRRSDLTNGGINDGTLPTIPAIKFSDGTTQTTAVGLASTQTFSGANTFASSVTVGPTSASLVANFSKIVAGNWSLLASTHPAGATSLEFTGLSSTQVYAGGSGTMKYRLEVNLIQNTSNAIPSVRFNNDSTASRHVYANNSLLDGGSNVQAVAGTSCYLTWNNTGVLAGRSMMSPAGIGFASAPGNDTIINLGGQFNYHYALGTTYISESQVACQYIGTALASVVVLTSAGTFTGDVSLWGMIVP